jgi:hypothetical protein
VLDASRCLIVVSGIGVRISIYLQAFLALVPACLLVLSQGGLKDKRPEELRDAAFVALAMGTSLVIAVTILALTSGAAVYHAFIVLNMSWINNVAAAVTYFLTTEVVSVANKSNVQWLKNTVSSFSQQNWFYLLHISAMSALGIWLFVRIDSFGLHPVCTHSTIYYLAGYYVPADQRSVRIFWIVIYSISAIPFVNFILPLSFVYGLDALVTRLIVGQIPPAQINYISLIIIAFPAHCRPDYFDGEDNHEKQCQSRRRCR